MRHSTFEIHLEVHLTKLGARHGTIRVNLTHENNINRALLQLKRVQVHYIASAKAPI